MDLSQTKSDNTARAYLIAGCSVFVSALVYYVVFRSQLPWPGYLLNLEWAHVAKLSDPTNGSYPSFAFALSLGLIALWLFSSNRASMLRAIGVVWLVALVHEVSMGTFSLLDITAATMGSLIALRFAFVSHIQNVDAAKFSDRTKLFSLLLVSICFATGTSAYEPRTRVNCIEYDESGTCIDQSKQAQPVYMSYATLRSSVAATHPRESTSVSRI